MTPARARSRMLTTVLRSLLFLICSSMSGLSTLAEETQLEWSHLATLPNKLGVAGPFVGVHNDVLIVAGGANFPDPTWDTDKVWYDEIHVLEREGNIYRWHSGGRLPRKLAYGAAVSIPEGVLCLGGNDASQTYAETFLLSWDVKSKSIRITHTPPLPQPCAYGQAVLVENEVFLAGGQNDSALGSAMTNFWTLDVSHLRSDSKQPKWQVLPPWTGPARAFNLTTALPDSSDRAVFVIGGRREERGNPQFLSDVYKFDTVQRNWTQRTSSPRPIMAGTAMGVAPHTIAVLGGADGELFLHSDELKDRHPGFKRDVLLYNDQQEAWTLFGTMPQNHVTTIPVRWGNEIIIASGEIRPRVRSPFIWRIQLKQERATESN